MNSDDLERKLRGLRGMQITIDNSTIATEVRTTSIESRCQACDRRFMAAVTYTRYGGSSWPIRCPTCEEIHDSARAFLAQPMPRHTASHLAARLFFRPCPVCGPRLLRRATLPLAHTPAVWDGGFWGGISRLAGRVGRRLLRRDPA